MLKYILIALTALSCMSIYGQRIAKYETERIFGGGATTSTAGGVVIDFNSNDRYKTFLTDAGQDSLISRAFENQGYGTAWLICGAANAGGTMEVEFYIDAWRGHSVDGTNEGWEEHLLTTITADAQEIVSLSNAAWFQDNPPTHFRFRIKEINTSQINAIRVVFHQLQDTVKE